MVPRQNAPKKFLNSPLGMYQRTVNPHNHKTCLDKCHETPLYLYWKTNAHKGASNHHKTRNNRLANAIAGIASQQRPKTPAILKLASTNTLLFDRKNEKFPLFEDLFHKKFKTQPEMTEAMKINHFHARLKQDALQTFRKINATNKRTLEDVLIVFRRKYVKLESRAKTQMAQAHF